MVSISKRPMRCFVSNAWFWLFEAENAGHGIMVSESSICEVLALLGSKTAYAKVVPHCRRYCIPRQGISDGCRSIRIHMRRRVLSTGHELAVRRFRCYGKSGIHIHTQRGSVSHALLRVRSSKSRIEVTTRQLVYLSQRRSPNQNGHPKRRGSPTEVGAIGPRVSMRK